MLDIFIYRCHQVVVASQVKKKQKSAPKNWN